MHQTFAAPWWTGSCLRPLTSNSELGSPMATFATLILCRSRCLHAGRFPAGRSTVRRCHGCISAVPVHTPAGRLPVRRGIMRRRPFWQIGQSWYHDWLAVAQLLIDFREQRGDKLHGHHTALLASQGCHTTQRGRVVGGLQAKKLTFIVLVVL